MTFIYSCIAGESVHAERDDPVTRTAYELVDEVLKKIRVKVRAEHAELKINAQALDELRKLPESCGYEELYLNHYRNGKDFTKRHRHANRIQVCIEHHHSSLSSLAVDRLVGCNAHSDRGSQQEKAQLCNEER